MGKGVLEEVGMGLGAVALGGIGGALLAPELGIGAATGAALGGGLGGGLERGIETGNPYQGLLGAAGGAALGYGGAELLGVGAADAGSAAAAGGGAGAVGGSAMGASAGAADMAMGGGLGAGADAGAAGGLGASLAPAGSSAATGALSAGGAIGAPAAGASAFAAPAAVDLGGMSAGGAAALGGGGMDAALGAGMAPTVGLAGPAAAAAPAAAAGGGIFSGMGSSAMSMLPLAGLGYMAMKQQQVPKGQNQVQQLASTAMDQSHQLQSYLSTGNLPPGMQQGLNQAADAAKAQIKSQYASRGMTGSSAENTDLASVDTTVATQGSQMALQLFQQGTNEAGMASQLYQYLMENNMQRDAALGNSIGMFSMALAAQGGGRA